MLKENRGSTNPVIQNVGVWGSLHECDGVEDVVDVVAQMEHWVGYDCLGGSDASGQQRQRRGQRQRRLELLHCCLLQNI